MNLPIPLALEFQPALAPVAEKPHAECWAGGEFSLYRNVLGASESSDLMKSLRESVDWQQRSLRMYGRDIPLPRLVAWYGDAGASYTYSGIRTEPQPWTPELLRLKELAESYAGETHFNSVLLNLYRDGRDSVNWHRDDEPELGSEPVLASLSIGAPRKFCVRPTCKREQGESQRGAFSVTLDAGSLLVMRGLSQKDWEHSIPKVRGRAVEARINLTFRVIL